MHALISYLLIAICVGVYLAPSMIAMRRMRREAARLFVLNIVLGWTITGWLGALSWATRSFGVDLRSAENAARWHRSLRKLRRAEEIF
jgi:H+/Cl- antiporter ClcA